ncbi:MAG: hypothetical protein HFI33_02520 [Lachnospiraceae bacterium]|nr:hypothetical protein [Lachnospiraceae bacterium]
MILANGDKRREKFLKSGHILWDIRNVGGLSKGIQAGGITFLVFAALIAIPFIAMGFAKGGLVFGGLFAVPGLLLYLGGALSQKRKMKNYLSYYQKETGFDLEELKQLEQELMEPDTFMVGNVPEDMETGASEKRPQLGCMITKHYFFMPMNMGKSYVRKLSHMLMAVYSQEIPGINGYKRGLVFLSSKDDTAYINALLTRDSCEEIIRELYERNSEIITQRIFFFGDRKYDIITDSEEIVALYQEQMEKAISFKSLLTFP